MMKSSKIFLIFSILIFSLLFSIYIYAAENQDILINEPSNFNKSTTGPAIGITTGSAINYVIDEALTHLLPNVVFCNLNDEEFFYYNNEGKKIIFNTVPCISNTSEGTYNCPIKFDSFVLQQIPTCQEITGVLNPEIEKGYGISNTMDTSIKISVLLLYDTSPAIEITNIVGSTNSSLLIVTGTNPNELNSFKKLPQTVECTTNENFFLWPISWSYENVDFNKVGNYYANCSIDLPQIFIKPAELPKFLITVLDANKFNSNFIDLSYFSGNDKMGNSEFKWIWQIPDLSKVHLFYSLDEGNSWTEDNSLPLFDNMYISESCMFMYTSNSLCISKYDIEANKKYYIKIKYENNSSNILIFSRDDNGKIDYSMGGDRDGSDVDSPDLPPLEQEYPDSDEVVDEKNDNEKDEIIHESIASENKKDETIHETIVSENKKSETNYETMKWDIIKESIGKSIEESIKENIEKNKEPELLSTSNSQGTDETFDEKKIAINKNKKTSDKPNSIKEYVTETTTVMSLERLKLLIAESDFVIFEKKGIVVEIPSSFLKDLDLTDKKTITVTIEYIDETSFEFYVYIDDLLMSNMPKFTIRMKQPKMYTNEALICADINDNFISDVKNDILSNTISMQICATGKYLIKPENKKNDPIILGTLPPNNDTPAVNMHGNDKSVQSFDVFAIISGIVILCILFFILYRRKRHGKA